MTRHETEASIATYVAAARLVGVTPATVSRWVRIGRLSQQRPWTPEQVQAAAAATPAQTPYRQVTSAHGTPSRWRAGCDCDACTAAHTRETNERREAARRAWWQERTPTLLAGVAAGRPMAAVLAELAITPQAVTAHRRRDRAFADRLDQALMAGRDPELGHGASAGWRSGCRCPECRAYHEASR